MGSTFLTKFLRGCQTFVKKCHKGEGGFLSSKKSVASLMDSPLTILLVQDQPVLMANSKKNSLIFGSQPRCDSEYGDKC
jgi:hypothetical protein